MLSSYSGMSIDMRQKKFFVLLKIYSFIYQNKSPELTDNNITTKKHKGDLYMKATGIVRRIDDLGRVVIPKEIRRTMRIREGDPLEIYTNSGGEVIFKKYSPIGELSSFASQYAEALNAATDLTVLICDRDHCIAASGISKKEVLERRVTQTVEDIMEGRRVEVYPSGKALPAIEGIDQKIAVAAPIMSEGDVSGAVVLTSAVGETASDSDIKLATVAASFLGKQMES